MCRQLDVCGGRGGEEKSEKRVMEGNVEEIKLWIGSLSDRIKGPAAFGLE